ncbi:hypothetical protein GXW82_17865 [Streptacidiphilus sp. 4-A2]|nr:hypothetical protein [Streptacidiphilus sp. 4-A2]
MCTRGWVVRARTASYIAMASVARSSAASDMVSLVVSGHQVVSGSASASVATSSPRWASSMVAW